MTDTPFINSSNNEILMVATYDQSGKVYFPEINFVDMTLIDCAKLAAEYSEMYGIDAVYKAALPISRDASIVDVTKEVAIAYSEACEHEPEFCDLPDWVQEHIDEAEYNHVRNEPDWRIEAGKEYRGSVL